MTVFRLVLDLLIMIICFVIGMEFNKKYPTLSNTIIEKIKNLFRKKG